MGNKVRAQKVMKGEAKMLAWAPTAPLQVHDALAMSTRHSLPARSGGQAGRQARMLPNQAPEGREDGGGVQPRAVVAVLLVLGVMVIGNRHHFFATDEG